MNRLKLHISPCPNDTFMFEAMIRGRIDTEGLTFDTTFDDIERLNETMLEAAAPRRDEAPACEEAGGRRPCQAGGVRSAKESLAPDISKVSFAAVPALCGAYRLLPSGAALGRGNGPVFVSAAPDADPDDPALHVAVPGARTTANLLLERLYPHLTRRSAYLFSDIADVVARRECDAGVLIHEGRFTYSSRGLHLICDLGRLWEQRTGLPLPLGAIMISRRLPDAVQRKAARVLRRSIRYALDHPDASAGFVRAHAQELSEGVMRSHIECFVNAYSLSLGKEGLRAVHALLGGGLPSDLTVDIPNSD